MASKLNNLHDNVDSPFNEADQEQTFVGTYDRMRAVRHSRWTRRETLILIEGKKLVENRIKEGYRSNSAFMADQLEPKWDSVASFCTKNGMNRGPAQCRKRWSNLLGDFKKIKSWESRVNKEAKSFWTMRNDHRKERKLPSSFDREVYEVLDGRPFALHAIPLSIYPARSHSNNGDGNEEAAAEEKEKEEEEETNAVFDEDQNATPQDGLFSEFEQHERDEIGQSAKNERVPIGSPTNMQSTPFNTGAEKVNCLGSNTWTGSSSQDGRKRKRMSSERCEESDLGDQLMKVLENNSNMLFAQLEAQNKNYQQYRREWKEHTDRLVGALNKLTEAVTRIADNLQVIAGKN